MIPQVGQVWTVMTSVCVIVPVDEADDVLKLSEMSEEDQLQWAMTESVKSSANAAASVVVRPLSSNGE